MPRTRRRFTGEFKTEAVRLLEESGRPLQAVAEELGVHANQLRGWRNEHLAAGSAEALARRKDRPTGDYASAWSLSSSAGGAAYVEPPPAAWTGR